MSVTGKISQKNVTGIITQMNVRGRITQKNVMGKITQTGFASSLYCPEFQAIYDYWPTKPDATRAGYYNWAVEQLISKGLFNIFDLIRIYGCHINSGGEGYINWKSPGTFAVTAHGAVLPVFTTDQGFQFNGANNYFKQNWVPSVNGVNFTRNSASQILYIRTNISAIGAHGTDGNVDTKQCVINPRNATSNARIRTNDNTNIFVANANGSGLYINTRTAAAINKSYRNAVAIINGTTASVGVPTHQPYTGCYDDDDVAAGFRADQVFAELWGAGLNQTQVTDLTNIINGLATLLGVNVF